MSIFKDFTHQRKKNNWAVVFYSKPLSNILKYRDHNETFQESRRKDSFRYIFKRLANTYES